MPSPLLAGYLGPTPIVGTITPSTDGHVLHSDGVAAGWEDPEQVAGIAAIKTTADAAIPASEKGASNGVAELDVGGRVKDAQAPLKALYATGGAQALVPSDIGALDASEKAAANGVASLNSSSLVVEKPADATTSPAASKIPIADGSGKLHKDWGGAADTLASLDGSGRLPAAQAPAASVYQPGGAQDIGALPAGGGAMTGVLDVASGLKLAFVEKATADSPYTASAGDVVVIANPDTGAMTINLPAASGQTGRYLRFKNIHGSNTVTLDPDGSETIDGGSTLVMAAGDSVEILCDGSSKWMVL